MGMRVARTGTLIGAAFIAAVSVYIVNCASATTITLDVRGGEDICDKLNETGIVVTSVKNIDNVGDFPLQEFQQGCANGRIGTLVITPHSDATSDRSAKVGIRVVAGLNGKGANTCDDPEGRVGEDCIIAKREISFVEGNNVPLTITLNGNCVHVTCDDGFECDPSQTDPQKRCVDRRVLTPGSSSSGGEEDATRPPIDAGPIDSGADTGPPTPEAICTKAGGNFLNNTCTFVCKGKDCKKPDLCPPGVDCTFLCNDKNACDTVHCSGQRKCEFNCTSTDDDQCKNIDCDASTCKVQCKGSEKACSKILFSGKDNDMSCGKVNEKPSCDDMNCVPGPGDTKCVRNCDGPAPNGCGPKAICDAGDCQNFEAGAL